MTEETFAALEHVDARRRRFLGKLLAGGATLAALPAMSTVALGDDEDDGDESTPAAKGKSGQGKGGQGKGGQGKGGQGKGGQGGKGGGSRMDPKKMAAEMLKKYDKDGDKALNEKELVAALTAMMKERQQGQGGGGQGRGKGGGQGNGGGGQGKGKGGGGGRGKGGGR